MQGYFHSVFPAVHLFVLFKHVFLMSTVGTADRAGAEAQCWRGIENGSDMWEGQDRLLWGGDVGSMGGFQFAAGRGGGAVRTISLVCCGTVVFW